MKLTNPMYSNLGDKETVGINPFLGADNPGSDEEKSVNLTSSSKNYEWSTEERNGVRYNRLNRVSKLPAAESMVTKNEEEKVDTSCCETPNTALCFLLIFILLLLSLSVFFFMWFGYREASLLETEDENTDKIGENIATVATAENVDTVETINIFKNTSLMMEDGESSNSSTVQPSTLSQTGLYFPL